MNVKYNSQGKIAMKNIRMNDEDEEQVTVRNPRKKKAKEVEEDDEEEELTAKPKKKAPPKQEEEEEEQVTVRKKKKGEEGKKQIQMTEEKKASGFTITLSGAIKKDFSKTNTDVELVEGCRVLNKEVKNLFKAMDEDKIVALATRNQVVHVQPKKTEIDFDDNTSLIRYMKDKGYNYNEVYSLDFLAKGGESYVLRVDLKQPIEVVLKTVLPDNVTQQSMTSIIAESHLVKLLEDKNHVVDIYEEIIEFNKDNNYILNYFVVIEQAVQDLKKIVEYWQSLQQSLENVEFFSNYKLFYFLFKAATSINYLHENHVYYGDMKEANLLLFRDYTQKLGDFGISMKMDENVDPDEEMYELKGATIGYTLPKLEEALQAGDGSTFSRNTLLQNDYYSLEQTFIKIKSACQKKFTFEGPKNIYDFHNYQFDNNSYFCQFLDEMRNLHPQTFPLSALIQKYQERVEKDDKFILGFCDQMITNEKYYALPNILKLWQHRYIPTAIQDYFNQEETKEFPFLNPVQKTQISSDKYFQTIKPAVIDKDDAITKIQAYIKSNVDTFHQDLLPYIYRILRYKGYLQPEFYNAFYRQLFQDYYSIVKMDHEINLLSFIDSNPGKLEEFIYQQVDVTVLERQKKTDDSFFQVLTHFFYFYTFTVARTEEAYDQVHYALCKQMNSYNGLNLKVQSMKLMLYLTLLENKTNKKDIFDEKVLKDYGSFQDLNFLWREEMNMIRRLLHNFNILSEKRNEDEMHLVFKMVSQCQFLFAMIEQKEDNFTNIQSQLRHSCEHFLPQKENFIINLYNQRNMLKKKNGELGNQMSYNGYQIYKLTKELVAEGQLSDQYKQNAVVLLIKACNYSTREYRKKFLIDIIFEFTESNQLIKFEDLINNYKESNPLIYSIMMDKDGGRAALSEQEKTDLYYIIYNSDEYELIGILLGQNEVFFEKFLDFFGLDPLLMSSNFYYILKVLKVKYELSQVIQEIKQKNQDELELQLKQCRANYKNEKGKQTISASFGDTSTLEVELSNFIFDGRLFIDFPGGMSIEEHYKQGERYGKFAYDSNTFKIFGEYKGDSLPQAIIESTDKSVYKGQTLFFKKQGCGENQRLVEEQDFVKTNRREVLDGFWKDETFVHGARILFSQFGHLLNKVEVIDGKKFGPKVTRMVKETPTGSCFFLESFEVVKDVKVDSVIFANNLDLNEMAEYRKTGENQWHVQKLFEDGGIQMEYNALVFKKKVDKHRVVDIKEQLIDCTVYYRNKKPAKVEKYQDGKPTGKTVFFDQNGKEMGSCTFENGKMTGKYFEFDSQSNIVSEKNFKNGEPVDGVSTFYFHPDGKKRADKEFQDEFGKVQKTTFFKDGKTVQSKKSYEIDIYNQTFFDKDGNELGHLQFSIEESVEVYKNMGKKFTYFDNMQVKEVQIYSKGLVAGKWLKYYPTGEVAKEANRNTGKCTLFGKDGSVLAESKNFQNTNIIDVNFYPNGAMKDFRDLSHCRTYFENGKLKLDQDLEGQTTCHYSDDGKYLKKVSAEGEEFFLDGAKVGRLTQFEKEGKHFNFFQNGKLMFQDEYAGNKLVSSKQFFQNGNLRREVQYENYAPKDKEWCYYFGGQLFKKAEYSGGAPHGPTQFFDKEGNVKAEVIFEEGAMKKVDIKDELYRSLDQLK